MTSIHYRWYNEFRVINSPKLPYPESSEGIETPNVVPFPSGGPEAQTTLCTYNECLSGHKWPATLAISKCPGCPGHLLAIQKTNCPFCNEPITRTVLRSDFLPRGAGVSARCSGQPGGGESLDIEMVRHQWREVEGTTKTFLEQEAAEIPKGARADG